MIKRFTAPVLMLALLLSLCACGEKSANTPAPSPEPDWESVYAEPLDTVYALLKDKDSVDWETFPELTGLYEMFVTSDTEDNTPDVGYAFQDFSGDGTPELALCFLNDSGKNEGSTVFALYALKDGNPVNVIEGYARSAYSPCEGGFYYHGSGGAIYAVFGLCTLSHDGTELFYPDFYFSHEKNDDYTDVGFFHNSTGEWDISASEEIAEDDFWEASNRLYDTVYCLDLKPFSDYTPHASDE